MTSNLLKIGFIGGGKMAQAMAKGFISAGLAKGETMISSCHPSDVASAKAFKVPKRFFHRIKSVVHKCEWRKGVIEYWAPRAMFILSRTGDRSS
jgi:hypothetical protein